MSAGARSPYLALRHRDFRWMGLSQLVSMTGTQMQIVALNWHVYLLTHSALALGLVGLSRVLPIITLSLLGGVVADRHDRRKVMLASQSAMALCALTLAALTYARRETVWALYLLNALNAAANAFDAPARHSLVPRLVPPEDLPGALAVNISFAQVATTCGPALAGLLLARHGDPGPALVYLINAASFAAVIVTLLTLRASGRTDQSGAAPEPPLRALKEGVRFVFQTPLLVWTTALDFFATFFAGASSLLPLFADQVLHVGPRGYGLLASAPAVGALLGSLYTSLRPLPARQGRVLLGAVAAYGAATVVFGLSRRLPLTLLALLITGAADLVSTVIRQTLRQLITPDRLRGRMTSVNMIFFMGGPQLGELEAGLVASAFVPAALGATLSVVSGGVMTLLVAAVVALGVPVLRRYDVRAHRIVPPAT